MGTYDRRERVGDHDASLVIEGVVDQGVIAPINDTVVVKIAVVPTGQLIEVTIVNEAVVGAVDGSIKVGVAEIGVADQNVIEARIVAAKHTERAAGAV